MRRLLIFMLPPALVLAGCTDQELPTGVSALDTTSPQFSMAARSSAGSIVAWGGNEWGQVNDTPSGNDFVVVAAGLSHATALRADGSLISWGDDGSGQVSDTPSGNDFVAVAAGYVHGAALRADGSIVSWGDDRAGQVSNTPSGNDFVAVSLAVHHGTALRADGSLVSWGRDVEGEISETPPGNDWVAVAVGWRHGTALGADGSLVSWGADNLGQVTNTPSGNAFVAVAGGAFSGTALGADSSLVSWGDNTYGQVSDTPSGNDFVAVAAGGGHGTALRADGSLVSWGWNGHGQVIDTPSGNDFVAVAAGIETGFAIRIAAADELAPTIGITSPADDAVYVLGQQVLADYACMDEDGGSGLASCTGTVASGAPIYTAEVGPRTFVVEAADSAGNTAALTHTYSVAYDFTGFSAPVNEGAVNAVKAGRTVPLKWRLVDAGGQPVTNLNSVNVTVEDMACEVGSTGDQLEESAPGASGLQNLGDGTYQFNWKTPKSYARSCKTLHLDLGEGLTRTATFRFAK